MPMTVLFRARDLVLAEQTAYEVLHDNDLVKLRHYLPLPKMKSWLMACHDSQ
jgi:hypothetical protein